MSEVQKPELTAHPLADIFPLMSGNEYELFKKDIFSRKQQEPITLYEGKILDGRNRYSACKGLGVTPITKQYEGKDPLAFVLSANLHRRHLNESQRAMVAAKLVTLKLGANQHNKEGPSIEGASELLNVGHASVERARKVIEKGVPELVQAVEQNKLRVSEVEAKLLGKSPEELRNILGDKKLLNAALKTSGNPDNASDAYDRAEKRLIEKLKMFSFDAADAAAKETTVKMKTAVADIAAEEKRKATKEAA